MRNRGKSSIGHAETALFFTARARQHHFAFPPSSKRAHGTPDARRIRSLVRKIKKHTSVVTTNTPNNIRRSARNGFTACFVLSPVKSRNLSPSSPRYFSPPVGSEKSRPDFAGPHDLGRTGSIVVSVWCDDSRALCTRNAPRRLTSRLTLPRPSHPASQTVTIASRPSQ
jgi:hypothetical protein